MKNNQQTSSTSRQQTSRPQLDPRLLEMFRQQALESYTDLLRVAESRYRNVHLFDKHIAAELVHKILFDNFERIIARYNGSSPLHNYLCGCVHEEYIGKPKKIFDALARQTTLPEFEDGEERSLDAEAEWRNDPAEYFEAREELEKQPRHGLEEIFARGLQGEAETWAREDSLRSSEAASRALVYYMICQFGLENHSQNKEGIYKSGRIKLTKPQNKALEARSQLSDRQIRTYKRDLEKRLAGLCFSSDFPKMAHT
jgi:hypothetical protein